MMNIERQFSDSIRNVSNGTAMKLPGEEADCKRPVAKPLSRRPNQSRTTRAPRGIGELRRRPVRNAPEQTFRNFSRSRQRLALPTSRRVPDQGAARAEPIY